MEGRKEGRKEGRNESRKKTRLRRPERPVEWKHFGHFRHGTFLFDEPS